jgi:agmatine deiminase
MSQTPRALGYRWPAEWEPHAATWLAWPHNRDSWPGKFEPVPEQFAEFVRTLARFEPVHILAGGAKVMAETKSLLLPLPVGEGWGEGISAAEASSSPKKNLNPHPNPLPLGEGTRQLPLPVGEGRGEGLVPSKGSSSFPNPVDPHPNPFPQGEGTRYPITVHDIPTNDAWCRDHGPIFLVDGKEPALVDWEYNAWGGKYPPFDFDNAVPQRIAAIQKRRVFSPGIVLEGGAIENNGRGVLLTTERCLLNPNRNAGLSRDKIEGYLRDYLSVEKILWLAHGDIPGDDTDGHIDQLARFVNPTTIVAAVATDDTDVCFDELQAMWEELTKLTDVEGEPFTIVPLPIPSPKFVGEQRLPCSYCNFLIVNGGVIVPQFNDPADAVALQTLQRLMPDREVVGSPSLDLIWGLGSFHCMSQQEPQLT